MAQDALPDLTELKGLAARSLVIFEEMDAMQNGRLSRSSMHPKAIPYDQDRYRELQLAQSRVVSAAKPLAQQASDTVISSIAEQYSLEPAHQGRPSVVVRDDYGIYADNELATFDWQSAPTDYVPKTSIFYSEGESFFGHPKGPVIVLYLPQVSHPVLVEEGTHYLQWFYERGTSVQDRMNQKFNRQQRFSQSILYESVAEVIRSLLGVNDEEVYCSTELNIDAWAAVLSEISGGDKSVDKRVVNGGNRFGEPGDLFSPELLVHTLAAEGRAAAYQMLLEDTGYGKLDDFLQSKPLLPTFPSNVSHFLGYGLGQHVVRSLHDAARVQEFGELVFSPTADPNARLDELIAFHQGNLEPGASSELLKRLRNRA